MTAALVYLFHHPVLAGLMLASATVLALAAMRRVARAGICIVKEDPPCRPKTGPQSPAGARPRTGTARPSQSSNARGAGGWPPAPSRTPAARAGNWTGWGRPGGGRRG